MINLDIFKKTGFKIFLIIGLAITIIILLIVKLSIKPSSISEEIKPTPIPSIDPYAGLPSLPPTVLPPDQQIQKEPIDNPLNNQDVVDFITQNPWYKQLPITTKSYIAIFDWNKQAIRISLSLDANSTIPREEQTSTIKQETITKLKNIGVDLNKIQVYYTFTP